MSTREPPQAANRGVRDYQSSERSILCQLSQRAMDMSVMAASHSDAFGVLPIIMTLQHFWHTVRTKFHLAFQRAARKRAVTGRSGSEISARYRTVSVRRPHLDW